MPASDRQAAARGTTLPRLRAAAGRALEVSQGVLLPAEIILPHPDDALVRNPPIFIVGAPRCGSTLLTQVLIRCLDVSYLSNRHARVSGAPVLVERYARPVLDPTAPYRSHHGTTDGAAGPSECAAWWYRFFPRDPVYVDEGDLAARNRHRFRRSVAALTAAADRPVLFKNLYASLRIREITAILPEAQFIHLTRDLMANAHSLLEARHRAHGDYAAWFSVPPPGWRSMGGLPPAEQVRWQIEETNRIVVRDLERSGAPARQIVSMGYEEFCAQPKSAVHEVAAALRVREAQVGFSGLPAAFPVRSEVRIPPSVLASAVEPASDGGEYGD